MPFRIPFLLLLLAILFSGCFDLVEEVTWKKDGSGTYHFEANLSQSKTKLDAILGIDSLHGFRIPGKSEIIREFEKAHEVLNNTPGISRVTDKRDFDNYIFYLEFDFRTVNDLNKALASIRKLFDPKTKTTPDAYRTQGMTFERLPDFDAKKEMARHPGHDLSALHAASLTCIYRFDQPISHFSNADARISQNGKALMLKLPVSSVLDGTKTISNIISLQD
ncbi:MAG TPA: hypothetical protein VGO45_03680 [Bacteroidia bacterium]|nr:hypothetical protein [Bacteroidia bacterium]